MGKAGEHCKLPCLMDSGIQLSIQKFQTFKRDRIKWFSPQEVNTASQLCGAIIYVCWMWWNECLWEERRPTPTTPSSPGALCILQGTVQFPSAQKSKQKDSRASAYGSKHTAVTNIKCGFYNAKKKYKEESSWLPCLGNNCPDRGTESCGCTNNSKGCTASPELGAQWEQWPRCSSRWFAPKSLLGDAMTPGAGRGTEPPPAPPAPNSFIIHSLFINNKLVTMNAWP